MPANNAPKPDHALVASLLPSISTPAAVLDPDGHMLKKTAQSVIAKLLNLLSIANILNAGAAGRRAQSPAEAGRVSEVDTPGA